MIDSAAGYLLGKSLMPHELFSNDYKVLVLLSFSVLDGRASWEYSRKNRLIDRGIPELFFERISRSGSSQGKNRFDSL